MGNPYLIDRPAIVSFSGGRTSAFMLRQILDAFGGAMPDDLKVLFCNTGKERPETLDFVERCSLEWSVSVVWLEYRKKGDHHVPGRNTPDFAEVNYATASRHGEPFASIIEARSFLPNPIARFCTSEPLTECHCTD